MNFVRTADSQSHILLLLPNSESKVVFETTVSANELKTAPIPFMNNVLQAEQTFHLKCTD